MKAMRAALPLLLSFAVVLAGCGPKARQYGGEPRPERPPSVVSLSPSASEIIASNMDASLLVGRTKADNFPTTVLRVPVVAEVKPDFEKIKGLKPGLVVYDADLFNAADVKRIEDMGIKTFALKARTVDDFETELYELAGILGNETNIADYANRINAERGIAEGDKPSSPKKVAVAMPGGYVAGTKSFVAEIVKIAGGVPVGPDSEKFELMSPEAMIAAAPQVIVLPTSKATGEADFKKLVADPRFRTTPAVRNKAIIPLEGDMVLRRGSRVNNFIKDLHHHLMRFSQ